MGPEAVSTRPREPSDAAPVGGSVLVVDDDPFLVRLLQIELAAAGYEVRTAGDGARALELAELRCPDLVIADVMMPTMDGFELIRRLRQDARTSSVRVIMLSALGLAADRSRGLEVGADEYVVKPFEVPELISRVGAVLGRAAEPAG